MEKILITGPLGQDGIILTKLLQKNYKLFGVCRNSTPLERINDHMLKYDIELIVSELLNINDVEKLIESVKPDVIINFAGETDVINPWSNVSNTFQLNFTIPNNILNSIVKINPNIFYFQSSSSMMFAKSDEHIINENSCFNPMYPYGISKLSSHLLLKEFRLKYNLKCSSGIFFNHESFYRNKKFVSKKISTLISSVLNGESKKIKLYDLNYNRDISHADDFMMGVKIIIDNKINDDFIFSSGKSINILEFCKRFFSIYNLNFSEYVEYTDSKNYVDNYNIIGDNRKLKSIGWSPKYDIDDLITDMVCKEIKLKI